MAEEKYNPQSQNVYLFEDPSSEKLSKEMLEFHGVQATSLLVLPLGTGDRRLGTLVLASLGQNRFSKEHANQLSLLSQPFAIALSNTIKHRNELRLFDRDFYDQDNCPYCLKLDHQGL